MIEEIKAITETVKRDLANMGWDVVSAECFDCGHQLAVAVKLDGLRFATRMRLTEANASDFNAMFRNWATSKGLECPA